MQVLCACIEMQSVFDELLEKNRQVIIVVIFRLLEYEALYGLLFSQMFLD